VVDGIGEVLEQASTLETGLRQIPDWVGSAASLGAHVVENRTYYVAAAVVTFGKIFGRGGAR